ncbi:hypothetical protein BWQ96_02924 [Gracilariopsis chorda]|uniref:Uncharacterized protein n=1 Tax=Gracilariopsis chorda TaxID=448386 RepID=A0A2V3IYW2_9FLOR|nr:hypothetical protein BWQ96_02924 [Gracilariopsis chorda]|eukprot:PXF47311.1 hypothetical protein BWQ96_02924 [Gracilariopsis chorda]
MFSPARPSHTQSSSKHCRQQQESHSCMACVAGRGNVDEEAEKNANGRLQGKVINGEISQDGDRNMNKRDDVDDAAVELAWQAAAVRQPENKDKAEKVLSFVQVWEAAGESKAVRTETK